MFLEGVKKKPFNKKHLISYIQVDVSSHHHREVSFLREMASHFVPHLEAAVSRPASGQQKCELSDALEMSFSIVYLFFLNTDDDDDDDEFV